MTSGTCYLVMSAGADKTFEQTDAERVKKYCGQPAWTENLVSENLDVDIVYSGGRYIQFPR